MQCPECNGDGEVKDPAGYRDNDPPSPPVEEEELKISMWNKVKDYFAENNYARLDNVIIITVLMTVLGLMGYGCSSCINRSIEISQKEAAAQKAIDDKKGFVIVQYDSNMKVTRCYVVHKMDGINVTGSSASIPVPDMNDIDGFARKLGVEDPNNCIR